MDITALTTAITLLPLPSIPSAAQVANFLFQMGLGAGFDG